MKIGQRLVRASCTRECPAAEVSRGPIDPSQTIHSRFPKTPVLIQIPSIHPFGFFYLSPRGIPNRSIISSVSSIVTVLPTLSGSST